MKYLGILSLCLIGLMGCTNTQTWRADGIGIAISTTGFHVLYGEVDRVPPGGYYKRERTIDLRPAWQTWFTAPDTNCLATSTIILDATKVVTNFEDHTVSSQMVR